MSETVLWRGARSERRGFDPAVALLIGIAVVGTSFALVHKPWLVTGAVLGALVLATALMAPFALVAVMLMIGPVDLSFLTGGFKALFPSMGGLDMNGIRLLGAMAGFVAYILFEPRARSAAAGRLGRLWILFLAYAIATIAFSISPLDGLRLFLKLAYPFLTFLVVIGVANTRERLNTLLVWTLIAAAVMTILVNPLLVMNGGYRVDAGFTRVGGLGIGDNPFAMYLIAMLLIAFTRFVLRGQLRYVLLSAVLIFWLALTMTRIAALASVTGLAVIGALAALTSGNRKMVVGTMVAAVVVAVILLPSVLTRTFGFVPSVGELVDLMRNPMVLYNSINWEGRELLWAILWGAIMTSPIIGLGLGSSTAVIRETFPDQGVQVAHNEYLRLATDTGVIGVALFAIACFVWLAAALRLSVRGNREVREFAFPAVAGLICWGIVAATDNPFDYYTTFTQYIGFLVAGAVVMSGETSS